MAFTYGFYNSSNGDRKYNAFQMTQMFDGIILDGVFEAIGQHFAVTAESGMTVNVGTGRAWFNHTWNDNDSVMPITLPLSDLNRSRYDAIVIEVGDPNTDRTNSIKVVSGAAAVNPVKPTLNRGATNNDTHEPNSTALPPYQHALAYILVKPGVEAITAADIEIVVGKDETPFVTGPIQTRSIEELFNQWDAQFNTWFSNLQAQLTDNVVANLQGQIDTNRQAIEEINERTEGLRVENRTFVDIITEDRIWTNLQNTDLNVSVLLFGGGGGNSGKKGGSGGYMTAWSGTIPAHAYVPVTIGKGGDQNANGGTTSFGAYASANGGTSDGDGGSGGGGMWAFDTYQHAGNAQYGGGGGGGGASYTDRYSGTGGAGGNGGMYGGGGGGGGSSMRSSSSVNISSPGGSKGSNGGKGGNGGSADGSVPASIGENGVSTVNMNLEFTGYGRGGLSGSPVQGSGVCGGGGGGGGGYGGNGGNGANTSTPTSSIWAAGGGGGGGGYGADGGNAIAASSSTSFSCGGGGGGYGGKGGNSGYSGQGYGAGGTEQNGFGGGGGGGYGKYPESTAKRTSGYSGVCIIRYTIGVAIVE